MCEASHKSRIIFMMKKLFLIPLLSFTLLFPGQALAGVETAQVGFEVTPRSGSTLYKNAFTPVNWKVTTLVSSDRIDIWPMIEANLDFPPATQMTFNPSSSTQVCPDSQISENTSPSTVENMVNLCPRSVLGHGTAKFALAQSTAPNAIRDGYMVIFNGGLVGGRPKIKITAWSYETNAGVYTEGILQADGTLDFYVPRLSSDSSVISLNLDIPGKTERVYIESLDRFITLPGGQDPNYARMKCTNGSFPLVADFLLGQRIGGDIITDSVNVAASTTEACTGATGAAKMSVTSIQGPGSAKSGKKTNYTVTVRNSGASDARGVVLKVAGKGVSAKKTLGTMMPATNTTVKLPLKFTRKGNIAVSFQASASGVKVAKKSKTVKVK